MNARRALVSNSLPYIHLCESLYIYFRIVLTQWLRHGQKR